MKLKAYDFNQSYFLFNVDHMVEPVRNKEKFPRFYKTRHAAVSTSQADF